MASSSSVDAQGSALLRFVVGVPPRSVPDQDSFAEWLAFAWRQRLVPVLYHLVAEYDVDLTDDQLGELHDAQVAAMSVAARLDQHLIEFADLLDPIGVDFVALKGAALANLDYPDPSWRQYGDLDVLVDGNDLHRIRGLLSESGWHEGYALPAGHQRFTHAITLSRGRGWELDLHQRLAHRAVGLRMSVPEVLSARVGFEVAGTQVWAPSSVHRSVHAAVHADMSRLESRRLSSVADVLLLAHDHRTPAADVIACAETWRIRPLVERSIRTAFRLADMPLPAEWATEMERPLRSRDRLIEAAYTGGTRRPVREELAHLRLMSNVGDRWRYLKSFVFAGDVYAQRNDRSGPMAQARYLVSRLRDR